MIYRTGSSGANRAVSAIVAVVLGVVVVLMCVLPGGVVVVAGRPRLSEQVHITLYCMYVYIHRYRNIDLTFTSSYSSIFLIYLSLRTAWSSGARSTRGRPPGSRRRRGTGS